MKTQLRLLLALLTLIPEGVMGLMYAVPASLTTVLFVRDLHTP